MTPLLLLGLAHAAEPAFHVTVELPEVPALYTAWAEARGWEGPRSEVACRALLPKGELLLCLRVVEEGVRRLAHQEDLSRLGLTQTQAEQRAAAGLTQSPYQTQEIEGGGSWWMVEASPGQEAAALLHPEWLASLGPQPVLAQPARGMLMAWNPGDPELDQIMAVAVRRMYEGEAGGDPVSPLCFQWTGETWKAWGEAQPLPGG